MDSAQPSPSSSPSCSECATASQSHSARLAMFLHCFPFVSTLLHAPPTMSHAVLCCLPCRPLAILTRSHTMLLVSQHCHHAASLVSPQCHHFVPCHLLEQLLLICGSQPLRGVAYQIFCISDVNIMIYNSSIIAFMKQQWNYFTVGSHHNMRTVGCSIRKVEDPALACLMLIS